MKIKDRLIIIIAIVVVIILCILYPSKQVYFEGDENINSIMNYSFGCSENENIDDVLKNQKYIYSRDNYEDYLEDYLAIIVYEDNKAYLNQYKVYYTKDGEVSSGKVNITLPHNCNFIISLPDNKETYEWNIREDGKFIKLNEKSNIDINYGLEDSTGFARENLYFICNDGGEEQLELIYEQEHEIIDKVITINISLM